MKTKKETQRFRTLKIEIDLHSDGDICLLCGNEYRYIGFLNNEYEPLNKKRKFIKKSYNLIKKYGEPA